MLHKSSKWVARFLVLLLHSTAFAVPPSDALLPDSTQGYVSVGNVKQLQATWKQTQLGQLIRDPSMKPFVDNFAEQVKHDFLHLDGKLGISLGDLEDVPGGEVAIALIRHTADRAVVAILVDISDHQAQAAALMEKIDRNLHRRKAALLREKHDGTAVSIYTWPQGEGKEREAVFFIHQDVLCGTDSREVALEILPRFSSSHHDSLQQRPAYRATMDRCQADAGELLPSLRWFVDPFGFIETARLANIGKQLPKGKDLLKVLARQGFVAIQGVGGYVNFYVEQKGGRFEILHRSAIFAPAVPGQEGREDKYELAARMLRFPNGGPLSPQHWVPREIATYASGNWEVQNAFDSTETLIDDLIGDEGAFQEILDGIEKDPYGPQIDLREELIGHLGNRVTLVTDYELPITPQSERTLLVAETTNATLLTQAIEKTMETDPNARRHLFEGHVVWEIVDEEVELPELTIESPAFNPLSEEDTNDLEEGHRLPTSAISVTHGHLFIASHFEFLKKVLRDVEDRQTLAKSYDYIVVAEKAKKLLPKEPSLFFFSRTDEEYRPSYELIRAGRMPEAESMLGHFLNAVLGENEEDMLRPQKIDGSKLPNFETVRRYLGPAGTVVRSEKNGWFLIAFMLNKESL